MTSSVRDIGRGLDAVADMKARIKQLREGGADLTGVIDVLWDRSRDAELGEGYVYEFAEQLESLRPAGERGQ